MNSIRYTVRLEPEYLTVIPLDSGAESLREFKIVYLKSPPIRDAARALLGTIAECFSKELFSDLCVQCGNCCRNRTVPVTSRTIEQIAHYLNCYDEELFRSEYIEKGHTWNERDGVLAKRGDSCVFLEKVSAHVNRCRIYPLRPSQCVSISSAGDACRKDRAVLISHIEEIRIYSETVEVKRSGERIFSFSRDHQALRPKVLKLMSLLMTQTGSGSDTERDVTDDLTAMAEEAKMLFYQEGLTAGLKEKIGSVVDAMERLSEAEACSDSTLSNSLTAKIDQMTAMIQHLLQCIDEEAERLSDECKVPEFERLHLFPECLEVTVQSDTVNTPLLIIYRDYLQLLHIVREMLHRIMSCADPAVLSALSSRGTECIHCGECCRSFTGEIFPGELEIIAVHLEMSVEEMWNRFLEPGVSTWNEHMAIFRSVPAGHLLPDDCTETAHLSRDRSLPLSQCPFLERRDDSLFYCSIYEVRPLVCRRDNAGDPLCRKSISLRRPEWCIDRITSIELKKDTLYLTAESSEKLHQKAAIIYLREHRTELAVVEELKREVQRIITSLQQNLQY
ncbi:MAG: YkgJ family cysteine cluster protein [Candidatus Xenobiia bacterium LiM19]